MSKSNVKVDRFTAEFERRGAIIPVRHKRSGKTYSLEQEVFEANKAETRPYVYVWPETGRHRGQAVWCYLDSLEIEAPN